MWRERPDRISSPATILVVEDELLIRFCAAASLADAGFAVVEAANAEQAVQALETHGDIGLVFTDVNMPGQLDGLGLAWEVSRRWPELPVIVTSGKIVPGDGDIPPGGRFLPKPYTPEALPVMVGGMLAAGAAGLAQAVG
jgi:CheY-like chemotaxis protein